MCKIMLSPFISDGMVIQHGVPFPIRGKGGRVSVTGPDGKTYQAEPDKNGAWQVMLDPVPMGGPYTMEIISGEDPAAVTVKDIYAGDLWLCAGQSNMEMLMDRVKDNFPEEWDAQTFPLIRQFKVPQEWDFSGPRDEFSGGSWLSPSKETLNEIAATPWFFAKNINKKYNIPVGLISASWGGTPVEVWMSREALADFPEKIAIGDSYADPAFNVELAAKTASALQAWEDNLAHEDRGLPEKWQYPQTEISGWDSINLPGDFADAQGGGLAGFCGVIWLCRDFDVTSAFAAQDAKVWLGTITDADTVYINGVETGNITYRYPPRKYAIPAGLLHDGKNRIAIRVTCANGDGGVTKDKPFRIFSEKTSIELAGTWKYRIGVKSPTRPAEFFFQRQPMGPFNAMIAPCLKYPFKGIIWYQGESNDVNPDEYSTLFKAMVLDWRKKNGRDVPFLFVQLPIYGEPSENDETASWAIIRDAQEDALSLPATGMAAALELGEWNDIHPLNKKDVGYRLFLAAEKTVFNNENTSPGPMIRSVQRRGEKLLLTFDNCGSGLSAEEKPYVSVAGGEGFVRCPAEIEGIDTVSVDISLVKNPEKALYAWANNPRDRQLYNSDGLPMLPFRVLYYPHED